MGILFAIIICGVVGWISWTVLRSMSARVKNPENDASPSAFDIWLSPRGFFVHLSIFLLVYTPLALALRSRIFLAWLPVLLLHAILMGVYMLLLRRNREEESEYEWYYDDGDELETIELADGTILEVIDEG